MDRDYNYFLFSPSHQVPTNYIHDIFCQWLLFHLSAVANNESYIDYIVGTWNFYPLLSTYQFSIYHNCMLCCWKLKLFEL
jgi:hypothetical protein